jgi:hypothetical protein
MKKHMLFLSIATAMVIGCGGGGGSNSSNTNAGSTVSGKVIDGPIAYAKVCVDENFNKQCDEDEPTATTDINGSYELKNVNISLIAPILVEPIKGQTIDTFTKEEFNKKLAAPLEGSKVNITPITTLVGAKIYELKDENNISKQAIKSIKEEIAKSCGLDNPDNLEEVDILQNPKIYAIAAALAEVIDINDIDQYIDFNKLKEGDLEDAIKDPEVKELVKKLKHTEIKHKDPHKIEIAIHEAFKEKNPNIIENLNKAALKELVLTNKFFNLEDEGSEIIFSEDNTFKQYNSKGMVKKGIWELNDEGLVLTYGDGTKITINDIKYKEPFIYTIIDNKDNYDVLVLPKNKDISQLPGKKPLNKEMLSGKKIYWEDGTYLYFKEDGTLLDYEINNTYKYTWAIENGILKITGIDPNFNDKFVANGILFDKKIIMDIKIPNKNLEFGNVIPLHFEKFSNNHNEIDKENMHNNEHVKHSGREHISVQIANKTLGFDTEDGMTYIVFNQDKTYTKYIEEKEIEKGYWEIKDNKIILEASNGKKEIEIEEDLGGVIKGKFNNRIIYFLVLNTTNPYVSINSSEDLKKLINFVRPNYSFNESMISGKKFRLFLFSDKDFISFNNDYTFNEQFYTHGKNYNAKGTWQIDNNGVLILNYTTADCQCFPEKIYIVLGEIEGNKYKSAFFIVNNGILEGAMTGVFQLLK